MLVYIALSVLTLGAKNYVGLKAFFSEKVEVIMRLQIVPVLNYLVQVYFMDNLLHLFSGLDAVLFREIMFGRVC